MLAQSQQTPRSTLVLDVIRVYALLEVVLAHATEVYLKYVVIPPPERTWQP